MMIARKCSIGNMRNALTGINGRYHGNITFRALEQEGEEIHFTLKVLSRQAPGALRSYTGKTTTNACWHVLQNFIEELFEVAEEAEVYSDWTGNWITKAGGNRQDKNIGTEDHPLLLSRACDCNSRAQKAIERLIPTPVMFRTRKRSEGRRLL